MSRNDDETAAATGAWRPVVAALANAEQRLLLAEVITGEARRNATAIPEARRDKALARLVSAGLLATGADGEWRVDAEGLRALLSAPAGGARPTTGEDVIDRFVRGGRIVTYPAKLGQRRRVLEWAAERTLSPGEVLDEAGVNARLEALTGDIATLRRYLVDAGMISRSTGGSTYRLADPGDDGVDPPAAVTASQDAGAPHRPTMAPDAGGGQAAAAARAAGLEVSVTRHGHVSSLAEAAAARGIEPRDLVKTLVVRRGDNDYVFVLVPGDRTFSWPKLRALLGTNRLAMPSATEAQEVTGYERGTITPFGSARTLPVFADREMAGRTISMGGGAHGVGLTLDADAALHVLDATVADLSDTTKA